MRAKTKAYVEGGTSYPIWRQHIDIYGNILVSSIFNVMRHSQPNIKNVCWRAFCNVIPGCATFCGRKECACTRQRIGFIACKAFLVKMKMCPEGKPARLKLKFLRLDICSDVFTEVYFLVSRKFYRLNADIFKATN